MRLRQLGKPAGSVALGATLTEVAPGGISFPRHAHYVNEEAIYVLSGSGEARIGDAWGICFTHDDFGLLSAPLAVAAVRSLVVAHNALAVAVAARAPAPV